MAGSASSTPSGEGPCSAGHKLRPPIVISPAGLPNGDHPPNRGVAPPGGPPATPTAVERTALSDEYNHP